MNDDWETLSPSKWQVLQDYLRMHERRVERGSQADQLVDTDLPLDDLLDNIDEVREFLKHIKSLKQ